MQAVILSGGFGTRLRPLTNTRPKALMPLGETTLLDYLIGKMPESVDRIILASNFMIDMIRDYVEQMDYDKEILVVDEPEPLGTGGALKNSQKYIDGPFVVFNGDLITSLDVQEFIDFHRSRGGIGSIALWEVEDPTAFGVIGVDSDDRINRFKEKPKPEEVFSNLINAGTYILEPEIFDHIEEGKKVSIEREVFPFVIDKEMYGFHFTGHWIDSGTQPLYLGAQKILLENQGKESYIAPGASIEPGADVSGYSVIYEKTAVGPGVRIKRSMIFRDCMIGPGSIIEGAIIGEGCVLGENCIVPEGCILGDKVSLIDDTRLEPNTRIPSVEE